ncbi:unnamed protein product [Sphagnum jensenii]|uniref:Uncharacterized protein n=1 Tax=Sphagnum jensenii TaxID=128206 RepID=A0ABP0W4D0_9BRYO
MAQVQALSIAEIIAHTKQQPLPKLNIFQSSHQVKENFRFSFQVGHTIPTYDTEIRYGYKIRKLEDVPVIWQSGNRQSWPPLRILRDRTCPRSPASDRGLLWRVTAAVAAAAIAVVESSLGSLRKREGLERRSGGEAVKTRRRRSVGS